MPERGVAVGPPQYCSACGSSLTPQTRFCAECGRPSRQAPRLRETLAICGLLLVALVPALVAGTRQLRCGFDGGEECSTRAEATGSPRQATAGVDAIDARAYADGLFNHVIDAAAAGDSASLRAFLPMAVMAYEEMEPLDADGLFHLSVLHRVGDDPVASLARARAILGLDEAHLLGLAAAAAAASNLGKEGEARRYYGRFADVYAEQTERPLPEYVGHSDYLARVKGEADLLLASSR